MATISPILVAGTGPAGLLAALGLARAGFVVALAGPPVRTDDRRTTALMAPALDFLDTLGVLESLEPHAAPLDVMRIVDATNRLVRSRVVTFRASEIDEARFGLNIENVRLNAVLDAAVRAEPLIAWTESLVGRYAIDAETVEASLADGTMIRARLVVAADGRTSVARQAAGIVTSSRAYRQAALVLTFTHRSGHANTSTELHTETGPFTQVPLPGRRSSLVWVVEPDTAAALAALDDETLSRKIEDRMQSMLGRVFVEPGRQIHPLSAALPSRFADRRIALVGEAAHLFPPIGAQGLNLGIRDIQDLIGIALKHRDDPGAEAAMRAYDLKRRPDILARAGAVNLLNRSLLSNMLPAQLARGAGLGALGRFSPLRALFMREGLRPGSGIGSLFSGLGEQVRR